MNKGLIAFEKIVELLTDKHKYVGDIYGKWKEPLYLEYNPFSLLPGRERQGSAIFYGSPGITASIGYWLRHILIDLPEQINLHMLREDSGNIVYAEAIYYWDEHDYWYEAVIVGGMTDFSGEGGRGYELVRTIAEFLETILDIPCEVIYHPPLLSEEIERLVEKLYNQAYESLKEAEAEYEGDS